MKHIPQHDFILVRFDKPAEKSKKGILLPDSGDDPNTGVVLAVGPGRETNHGHVIVPSVKKDDYIKVNRFAAIEVDEREHLYLIDYSNIYCIIEK